MPPPIVVEHDGASVVRDDLVPGGTKARYLAAAFEGVEEVVYASPACGGAQTALAHVARALGKHTTIFVAASKVPHPRAVLARSLGAQVIQVPYGYLNVVQAAAKRYVAEDPKRRTLLPFGGALPTATAAIAAAALATKLRPRRVWCAAGSGVLATGLHKAWPDAEFHLVQVGTAIEAPWATVHIARSQRGAIMPFGYAHPKAPPFPSDPHYDAKAWWCLVADGIREGDTFWNVAAPASLP